MRWNRGRTDCSLVSCGCRGRGCCGRRPCENRCGNAKNACGDYGLPAVTSVHYQLRLGHADLTDLVAMGPNARHLGPDALAVRVAALPSPVTVTVDVQVRAYQG